MDALGRLERVELRDVWTSESGEFTPWLTRDENLKLLGETIGLELELESQEQGVGPFRADLLCRDTAVDRYVLVENQLERTDHTHLGQLMTYAAGLDAVVIVWVASRFTEEHRAALDWLNQVTNENVSFFGLEVELWRIGESPAAPKFNIVSKPNEWTRTPPIGPASDTQRLRLEFWTTFATLMANGGSPVRLQSPQGRPWLDASLGRGGFHLTATVAMQRQFIRVGLVMTGPSATAHYRLLEQQKPAIEQEIRTQLDWDESPESERSQISIRRAADPTDRPRWPEQHEWLRTQLEAFDRVFRPRVKALYIPEAANGPGDDEDDGDKEAEEAG